MNFHRDGNINKILLLSVHSNTETVHAQTYCPFMYLYCSMLVTSHITADACIHAARPFNHCHFRIAWFLNATDVFWLLLLLLLLSVCLFAFRQNLMTKNCNSAVLRSQHLCAEPCRTIAEKLSMRWEDVIECILYIYVVQIWCDVIEVRPFFLHSIRKMQTLITLTSVQCDWCRCAIRIAGHAW